MALWQVMATPKKSALIISSNVNGLDPLEGVYQNVFGASKVLMKMDPEILPDCSYGGELSFSEIMQKIEKFFGKESEVHILWGIFHGAVASIESCGVKRHIGCWVLSNNEQVSLSRILQKWDDARARGTAHHLLIISDACYSGHMVTEAAELELEDVSVQASCHPSFTSLDTEGECFSDLLVWRLERRYGFQCHRERKIDMKVHLERSILNCHQPCFYSAVSADDLGWAFIDKNAVFPDLSDSSESCSLDGSVAESDEGSSLFVRKDFYFLGEVVIVYALFLVALFQPHHLQSLPSARNGMTKFIRLPMAAPEDFLGPKHLRNHHRRERPGIGSCTEAQKRLRGCRVRAWVQPLASAGMWRSRRRMEIRF